jgi:hypothetical protein
LRFFLLGNSALSYMPFEWCHDGVTMVSQ